jgi:hypothetical protein
MTPTLQPIQPRPASPRLLLAAGLLWTLAQGSIALAAPLDEATKSMLVNAVEAAFELDFYNRRCRSDQSGRRSENLNKELVSSYRMTVLDVQDDYFPEGYYRDAQARMQADFLEQLRDLGGCEGAKAAGLRDSLRKRYEDAMAEVARQH